VWALTLAALGAARAALGAARAAFATHLRVEHNESLLLRLFLTVELVHFLFHTLVRARLRGSLLRVRE